MFKVRKKRRGQLIASHTSPANCPSPSYADLTPTEIHIVGLIRKFMRTKEIADILSVSQQTVMWHRKNIRKKLNLTNQKESLVNYLLQQPAAQSAHVVLDHHQDIDT